MKSIETIIEVLAISAVGIGMLAYAGMWIIVFLVCANQKYKWAQ